MARSYWTRPFYQMWMACSEGTLRQQEWVSFSCLLLGSSAPQEHKPLHLSWR